MNDNLHGMFRVYILDELVANSGKVLTSDLIGKITGELVHKLIDLTEKQQY